MLALGRSHTVAYEGCFQSNADAAIARITSDRTNSLFGTARPNARRSVTNAQVGTTASGKPRIHGDRRRAASVRARFVPAATQQVGRSRGAGGSALRFRQREEQG